MIRKRSAFRFLLLLWVLSTFIRALQGWSIEPPDDVEIATFPIEASWVVGDEVTLAYRRYNPGSEGTPILLLHGNPVAGKAMTGLARHLGPNRPIIVPDLPGLGHSSRNLVDFSAVNQVRVVRRLLDRLEIDRVHLVAYSQGGAAALEFYRQAPEQVESISLLAAVGLQEHELLRSYDLNQPVYTLYQWTLRGARWLLPHFGLLDTPTFDPTTAQSFADTDLRRNRAILESFEPPALILHSPADALVPYSAAKAHAKLMPHAAFEAFGSGHMSLLSETEALAERVNHFLERVDSREAPSRTEWISGGQAPHQPGIAISAAPISRTAVVLSLMLLLVLLVYVSEDLTCITGGLLASADILPLSAAIFACALGIWISDLVIFMIGRMFGTKALETSFIKRRIRPERVAWLQSAYQRRGLAIVVATRFLPGSRVIAYLIAGTLRLSFARFALWLGLAVALWTPILVGAAYIIGEPILERWQSEGLAILPRLGIALLLLYLLFHFGAPLATSEGRLKYRSWWRRTTRWEYWPSWAIYWPVFLYGLLLALRYRSATVWALCNPGIEPLSGLAMESKSAILSKLTADSAHLLRWTTLEPGQNSEVRLMQAEALLQDHQLDWPIVIKPDIGERGQGVAVARSREALEDYLNQDASRCILQEYVSGQEFGVFFVRPPGKEQASIFSITEKHLPSVVGDGKKSLRELILEDARLLALSDHYLAVNAQRLEEIVDVGERVPLVELGTHSRGAIFYDANHLISPTLAEALNHLVPPESGIHFGRFDLRAPDAAQLKAGRAFKIIELNGVSSESTDIYDPGNSILQAWRQLFRQWRLAFSIGAENRSLGHKPPSLRALVRVIADYRQNAKA